MLREWIIRLFKEGIEEDRRLRDRPDGFYFGEKRIPMPNWLMYPLAVVLFSAVAAMFFGSG